MAKSSMRVLEMLGFIAGHADGCSHTEVARALGIPKSSVTFLLRDLVASGYARYDEDTARYHIGHNVLTLSSAYLRGLNLVRVAQPVVTELFMTVNEFSALAIPKDDEYIIVCAESPPMPLAHRLQIGERGPMLGSASGKAILSTLPDDQLDRYLRQAKPVAHTDKTVTDKRRIRSELMEVRKSGVAFTREEIFHGVTAVGSPVRDAAGRAIAAISVALPSARLTPKLEKQIASAVKSSGERLSRLLGWTP